MDKGPQFDFIVKQKKLKGHVGMGLMATDRESPTAVHVNRKYRSLVFFHLVFFHR